MPYRIIVTLSLALLLIALPLRAFAAGCEGFGTDVQSGECEEVMDKNVLGEPLELCCNDPKTGFYRNGFCQTGTQDAGTHVACAIVTDEFLQFSKSRGNDLITPHPEYDFPGLKAGDKWCLCAARWTEALEAGVAPKLVLAATHEKMREYADLDVLKKYASDTQAGSEPQMTPIGAYQFTFQGIDGKEMPLTDYKGQVLLVVNTASQCGFTKQYAGLEKLYETYKDKGFTVIGVPCNQFGGQEPGSAEDIQAFAKNEYGITFPLTAKTEVKGDAAHPFFKWAADQDKGGFFGAAPKWNFHKYLIDREGRFYKSYGSTTAPEDSDFTADIEKLLAQPTK